MATQAAVRQEIRDTLYSARPPLRPFQAQLSGSVAADSADTTIPITLDTNWAAGDILELPAGEQCLVLSTTTGVVNVVRAVNATTLEVAASGDLVTKSPRFTVRQIDGAIDYVLGDLPGRGVYAAKTGDVALVASTHLYHLTETDILAPWGVLGAWYENDDLEPIPLYFQFTRHVGPSGVTPAIYIPIWPAGAVAGDDIYFSYAGSFSSVTALGSRQEDLVVLGAVGRLLGSTIVPETHDPGKRTDRTVPPGQSSRDARWFTEEYRARARREEILLREERGAYSTTFKVERARRWRP